MHLESELAFVESKTTSRPPRRGPSAEILAFAKETAHELAGRSKRAVVLTGSHARGTAGDTSDIDLAGVGRGNSYRLYTKDERLVSISWRSVRRHRTLFYEPHSAPIIVPGWRRAIILRDPVDEAAELKHEARVWDWDCLGVDCDVWVAQELTSLAEEVHKLVGSVAKGRPWTAAAQRSILALRMAQILAVHLRLLYETENGLWERVAETLGPVWKKAQAAAFVDAGQPFLRSCRGALNLFLLATNEIGPLLSYEQQDVIDNACRVAEAVPMDLELLPEL